MSDVKAEKDELPVYAYADPGSNRVTRKPRPGYTLLLTDHATATSKLAELQREVEGLRAKARRYDFLASRVRTEGSGEKFNLPKWGVIDFSWQRIEWRDGKPFVAMELDAAIDRPLSGEGGGNA